MSFLTIMVITICSYAQDIIVTKDAKKIDAKILEVSISEIRYKELDNLEGPIFILSTDDIVTIIYANGKVVLYNDAQNEAEALKKAREEAERARKQAEAQERQRQREEQARLEAEYKAREAAEAERKAKEAEAIAKANELGATFGNTSSTGQGNPVGYSSSGGHNWSLAGRDLKGTLPLPSNAFNQEGKVIVQIRVDAAGNVVEAKYKGGNVTDKQTIQIAIDAAKKAKFTEGDHDQIGTITYIFKLN